MQPLQGLWRPPVPLPKQGHEGRHQQRAHHRVGVVVRHAQQRHQVGALRQAVVREAAAVQLDAGYRGLLSVETHDDAGAERLREVLNGLVALARVQSAQRPEWRTALGTLQPDIQGRRVSISVELTPELLSRLLSGGALR